MAARTASSPANPIAFSDVLPIPASPPTSS
jgi:hypothetical protein